MRPIDVHVTGGRILILPAAMAPATMARASDRVTQAAILNRIAHDRRALIELRADWPTLRLAAFARELTPPEMLRALARAAADRAIVLIWVPHHAGPAAAAAVAGGGGQPVANWARGEKIAEALRRSIRAKNVGAELRALIEQLLSPLNIAITIGMMLALAAANAVGIGVVADLVLVGLAWYYAGTTGVRAIWNFAETTVTVMGAQSEADIDRAATAYTHALVELGSAFLAAFLARVQMKRVGTAAEAEGAEAAGSSGRGGGSSNSQAQQRPASGSAQEQGRKAGTSAEAGSVVQRGGAHRDVRGEPGYESHHVPADSISPHPTNDGPAVAMQTADHRQTASWGNSREARAYRAQQKALIDKGDFRGAQQMDINDIRGKFGSKYDEGIRQMLDYTRKKGY